MTPAKRSLYLNLRRALKVRRRFDIEDGGVADDGAVCERQTCRTCGVTILHEMRTPSTALRDITVVFPRADRVRERHVTLVRNALANAEADLRAAEEALALESDNNQVPPG